MVVHTKPVATATNDGPVCDGGDVQLTGGPDDMSTYSWVGPGGYTSGDQSPLLSPAVAGTYTLTVTDTNGCQDSEPTTVVVNPNPDCTITAPDVCENTTGNTASVPDAGTGATYAWTVGGNGTLTGGQNTNSITWSAGSAGTATIDVTVTAANSCACTATQKSVTIYANPVATASNDGPYEVGDTINLTGGPGGMTSYSWTGPDGFTSTEQSLSIPGATEAMEGTYTLTVVNENGCTDEASTTVEITSPPPTQRSGRGLSCPSCTMKIDMLGEIAEIDIGCCSNKTLHNDEPSDPDDIHFLLLDSATAVICGETADCGNYPKIIVMREAEDPEEEPENGVFVGPVYDFTGYEWSNWEDPDCPICGTVTFGQAVSAIIGYDPEDLPEGTVMVGLYVFDPELGEWVLTEPLPGVVAGVGQANGLVNHFSQLAVIAELPDESPQPATPTASPPSEPAPLPAHFTVGDLTIAPNQARTGIGNAFTFMVRTGESVDIAADVSNDGGQEGSYSATLKINGEVLSSKNITLQPGQIQQVIFTVTEIKPGQYVVQIGDLSEEFETVVWTNWWLIGGIIAGTGVLVWLAWYYYRRRNLRPPG